MKMRQKLQTNLLSNELAFNLYNEMVIKVQQGAYKTLEEALDMTFSETTKVMASPRTILDLYELNEICVQITEDHLQRLYLKFCEKPSALRFGQYVYNETNMEYGDSYYIRDAGEAFQYLLKLCKNNEV